MFQLPQRKQTRMKVLVCSYASTHIGW